jgi:hypothetical protein
MELSRNVRTRWSATTRRRPQIRPTLEQLEARLTPSWTGKPPTSISVPTNAAQVTLDAQGAATGNAAITANEVDYFSLVTPASGVYRFSASTPSSNMDTVLGLFNSSGSRVAYNNDISRSNTDSQLSVSLSAGTHYYFGITNNSHTPGGAYTWAVTGPAGARRAPAGRGPAGRGRRRGRATSGSFNITLNVTGMTTSQQLIFQQAAARWEQVITGDLPDATYNGHVVDDVLIDASGAAIDGVGGVLGEAGPDALRAGSYLPIHGTMQFDTADLANMEANGTLLGVITHEMGHVLGIGTIWNYKGLISGSGGTDPRFTGAQATAAYNQIFGRSDSSVPVENTGGSGTRDCHWRESVFGNELMTGWVGPGTALPMSRVTVASLADLGYQVNLNAADPYTPPTNATGFLVAAPAAPTSPGVLAEPVGGRLGSAGAGVGTFSHPGLGGPETWLAPLPGQRPASGQQDTASRPHETPSGGDSGADWFAPAGATH